MLITPQQLNTVATNINSQRAEVMAGLLNELCQKYGITDTNPFQMFLANVIQESGEFAHKQENMNYRPQTLMRVWPSRFKTLALANQYAGNPEKLANLVYANRMGNGDTASGDGWEFKGGGFIGLTGRTLYTQYAKFIGMDVKAASDSIRNDDRFALDSACWFFAIFKKLIPVAQAGNFKAVVKGINGGYIGLDVRQMYYDRLKKVFL
jgi:putative chitinase